MRKQHRPQRPKHNPRARDSEDVLGTTKPDTVSAASWNRPYEYVVVRVNEDRIDAWDDHELGRAMSGGLYTRHNAIARKVTLERGNPDAECRIVPEPNDNYDEEWKQ